LRDGRFEARVVVGGDLDETDRGFASRAMLGPDAPARRRPRLCPHESNSPVPAYVLKRSSARSTGAKLDPPRGPGFRQPPRTRGRNPECRLPATVRRRPGAFRQRARPQRDDGHPALRAPRIDFAG